jgi:hypothetical protein
VKADGDPEDGGCMFLRNVGLPFNGRHGIISQKVVFFIITAVRTSDPTIYVSAYLGLNLVNTFALPLPSKPSKCV